MCTAKKEIHNTKTSWKELGIHTYIKILIIAGLFFYLFHGDIRSVIHRWQNDNSWSHGVLIPLFSLYFIHQSKREILNLGSRPNYLGLLLLVLVLGFYTFNKVSPSGYAYLQKLSIIAAIGAIALLFGGWRLIRYTWLPIGYLIFSVPVPDRLYRDVSFDLQRLSAEVSAALLGLVPRMITTVKGVTIDVIYKGVRIEPSLNVAEACSGMRLLVAFLALGVAVAYLYYRPVMQRVVLLISTIPIAVFCNIVRVSITGFIYVLWDPRYSQGIYHDLLGIAMLPLAFVLFYFLGWFMSNLFVDESQVVKEDVVYRRRN